MVSMGEETNTENKDPKYLNEVFKNKRREIISGFRFGYAIQERIINMLFSNSDKKIKELPNVIFYKKKDDKHNKDYIEVDRIVLVDENEDAKISNFLVYLKTQFKQRDTITETFEVGETLVLPKYSLNFIEVKTSSNFLKEKVSNKEFEVKSGTSSDIFSSSSNKDNKINSQKIVKDNSTKMAKEIIHKINVFSALFHNINIKYSQINLIIIIDSYFQKDFIDMAKKFSEHLAANNHTDLNLFFVHIGSDVTYISESSKYNKLNEDFNCLEKKFEKEKIDLENRIKNQKKDFEKKYENQEKDFQKKYDDQKKDFQKEFKKKNDDFLKLKKEQKILNDKLNKFINKDKLRKIKKKIEKLYFQ